MPSFDWRPQLGFLHARTKLAPQDGQNVAASSFTAAPHFGHLFLKPLITDLTLESIPPVTALWACHFRLFLMLEANSSIIPIFLFLMINILSIEIIAH